MYGLNFFKHSRPVSISLHIWILLRKNKGLPDNPPVILKLNRDLKLPSGLNLDIIKNITK